MWNGQLNQLRFCDGSQRYVFKEELTILANSRYTKVEKISVVDNAQEFKITYSNGTIEINNLTKVLQVRPENNGLEIDPVSTTDGEGGLGDGNGGDDEPSSGDGGFQVSYFVYDHLENTRIVYHTVLDCNESEVNYVLEHAVDYYPYGKVLREYTNCEEARYLTTQHERDQETGLDYRGARFYDSDIGRFLSVDPLAEETMQPYSAFNNNPIRFIDPDGRKALDWYNDADGNYVYDSNITSQQDLDDAGIEGTYLGETVNISVNGGADVTLNADGSVSSGGSTHISMSGGDAIDFGWESGHRVFSGNSYSGNAQSNYYSSFFEPSGLFQSAMVSYSAAGFSSIPLPKSWLANTPSWFHGGYGRGWTKGSKYTSVGSFGYRRLMGGGNAGRLIPGTLSRLGTGLMWADGMRTGIMLETDSQLNALRDNLDAANPYRGFVPGGFRTLRIDWQGIENRRATIDSQFRANQRSNPYRGFVIGR